MSRRNFAAALQPSWEGAACKDDADLNRLMYDEERVDEAKAFCNNFCAIREECGEYAISIYEHEGVWGGLTGIERDRLRRKRQKKIRDARKREAFAS